MISFCMLHDNIFALRDPGSIWSFKIVSNLANLFIISKIPLDELSSDYHHRHKM